MTGERYYASAQKHSGAYDLRPLVSAGGEAHDESTLRPELQRMPRTKKGSERARLSPQSSVGTVLKACIPNTRWTICLLAILVLQLLIIAAFEAQLMVTMAPFLSWQPRRRKPNQEYDDIDSLETDQERASVMLYVQLGTVLFEASYQIVLGLNAIRVRNIVHAAGICVNNASILLFIILAGIGIDEQLPSAKLISDVNNVSTLSLLEQESRAELLAIFASHVADSTVFIHGLGGLVAVLGLCTLALIIVSLGLYKQFAWAIYRHIATGEKAMRRRYLIYEVYVSLLHLDFFFILGFWVQSLAESRGSTWFLVLGLAALLSAPPILFLAGFFVRREKRWACYVTLFFLLYQPVSMGLFMGLLYAFQPGSDKALPRTTAYGCLALLTQLAIVVLMFVCMSNFGKGLRPYLTRNQIGADSQASTSVGRYSELANEDQEGLSKLAPARMELD